MSEPLTWREMEIECLAVRGLTYDAIAHYLEISRHTAKRHFESLLAKRAAATRYELKTRQPREEDFVGYIGPEKAHRNKVWEIFNFETDSEGYNAATLIDPAYDGPGELEPIIRVRDYSSELFVIET